MTSFHEEIQNRYPFHTSLPKRSPYKFLTQTLTASELKKACIIKRVYLRRFIDDRENHRGSQERIYKLFKNNKLFKTLRNANFCSFDHSYALESLKISKLLQNLCITSSQKKVAICLKTLPNSVLHIRLQVETYPRVIYKIPKYIGRLPNLQSFVRDSYKNTEIGGDKDHVSKELKLYNKLTLKQRKLKEIVYSFGRNQESSFQRAMRSGIKNPGITGLEFTMGTEDFVEQENFSDHFGPERKRAKPPMLFEAVDGYMDMKGIYEGVLERIARDEEEGDIDNFTESFHEYDPEGPCPYDDFDPYDDNPYDDDEDEDEDEDEDDEYDDEGNKKEYEEKDSVEKSDPYDRFFDSQYICDGEYRIMCRMREEMKQFYRFELFPNLKKLTLKQESFTYPLGDFVVEGFEELKNLEELTIHIRERSQGTNYLFQGLLELPLLKRFSLNINFLKVEDWNLLEQFLKGQKKLETFGLELGRDITTRNQYERHNNHLQILIQCLTKKPHLRSLELMSEYFSFEALSKGFAQVKMANQLRTFRFEASDNTITSKTKPEKRVEGLCKFIENQKDSLVNLHACLPLYLSEKIALKMTKTISKLTHVHDPKFEYHDQLNFSFLKP